VLGIGVHGDQFCAVDAFLHHAGDGVRPAAAAADHRDLGLELGENLIKVFIILRRGHGFVPRLSECLFNN
jgi:hypothetical protein